jgi:hypothetical protein
MLRYLIFNVHKSRLACKARLRGLREEAFFLS